MGRFIKKFPVLSFVLLTFLINWSGIAVLVAGYFPSCWEWTATYDGHPVADFRGRRTLLVWAPNIAAMIVATVLGGRQAVGRLMGQFLVWRSGARWWLTAVCLPVALAAIAVVLYTAFGGTIDWTNSHYFVPVFFLRFLFSLSTGSIGEEAGWRGFALPLMQEKMGALGASVLIGLLWAMSHSATWSLRALSWEYIGVLTVCFIGLSVVLAWIYNRTGSLLSVALAHAMFNVMESVVSRSPAAVMPNLAFLKCFAFVLVVFAVVLAVVTRGRLGYQLIKSLNSAD